MRWGRSPRANQADLRVGLSQAQNSTYTRGTTRVGVECIESTFGAAADFVPEPDLPTTFIRCSCGAMVPLHSVECDECHRPHPRHLAQAVRCARCGDEDAGPWAPTDDGWICESCLERAA